MTCLEKSQPFTEFAQKTLEISQTVHKFSFDKDTFSSDKEAARITNKNNDFIHFLFF